MPDPPPSPINKLQYAPEDRDDRPPISPLRLGAACIIWSFPLAFAVFMASLPPKPEAGAICILLAIPFAIATGLTGVALLQGRRGWLASLFILFLLFCLAGWRIVSFLCKIDLD